MHYDSVLAYVKKVLENRRISCMIYEEPFENVELLDHGLRESLYKGFDKDLFFKNSSNFIYYCANKILLYRADRAIYLH